MIKTLSTLTAVIALSLGTLCAQAENVLGISGGDATTVGIYIKDLHTGQVLADVNSELALTPASVTKAVTTATALCKLGADFRFSTTVELEGERSASTRSRWDGNLLINGVGDPTLGSDEFKRYLGFSDSIVSHLKQLGVSEISGTVMIRETMPDAGPVPQWECEDIAWPYGAGLYGFNWAANTVRVYPSTGKTIPASNLKVTVHTATDGRTDLLRGINSENLSVWASKKNASTSGWNVSTTVPDPAAVYAGMLKQKLKASGIKVGDRRATAKTGSSSTKVYVHRSPQLREICRSLMKRSDNLFAEGMLRALLPGQSRAKCIKAEKEFWTEAGLEAKYTIINDGSGLTRANRFSPRFLGGMLEWMARHECAATYVDFFPISGVDGTLKSFLSDTPLKGKLAMKTGSVSSVQAYAGYKLDASGKPSHVVVVMVNGFFCARRDLKAKIEKYLLKIFNTPETK